MVTNGQKKSRQGGQLEILLKVWIKTGQKIPTT